MGEKALGPEGTGLKMDFETFEHGADIGVRGYGKTLEEAFQNAAKAMFSIMVEDFEGLGPLGETITVECSSMDMTGLLVAYLNTLLAEADIHRVIFKEFTCSIDKDQVSLKGTARGAPFPRDGEGLGIEVKGATFTMATVEKDSSGLYTAQCVVDV